MDRETLIAEVHAAQARRSLLGSPPDYLDGFEAAERLRIERLPDAELRDELHAAAAELGAFQRLKVRTQLLRDQFAERISRTLSAAAEARRSLPLAADDQWRQAVEAVQRELTAIRGRGLPGRQESLEAALAELRQALETPGDLVAATARIMARLTGDTVPPAPAKPAKRRRAAAPAGADVGERIEDADTVVVPAVMMG